MLSSGNTAALSTNITTTTALCVTYICMDISPHSTSDGFDSSHSLWRAGSDWWRVWRVTSELYSPDSGPQVGGDWLLGAWVDVIGMMSTGRRKCLVANESSEEIFIVGGVLEDSVEECTVFDAAAFI